MLTDTYARPIMDVRAGDVVLVDDAERTVHHVWPVWTGSYVTGVVLAFDAQPPHDRSTYHWTDVVEIADCQHADPLPEPRCDLEPVPGSPYCKAHKEADERAAAIDAEEAGR